MSLPRPDTNAKYIFFAGLLGLPWLWIVNVMYHWKEVYGKVPLFCCGGGNETESGDGVPSSSEQAGSANTGLLSVMANDGGNGGEQQNQEDTPSPDVIHMELSKWIKRSTIGSFIYTSAFITWVLVFQLNRDSFGPKWFVMSQDEEIRTGW